MIRFLDSSVNLLRKPPPVSGLRPDFEQIGAALPCQISYLSVGVQAAGAGPEAVTSLQLGWPAEAAIQPQVGDRLVRLSDGAIYDVAGQLTARGRAGGPLRSSFAPLRQIAGPL